MSAKYRVSREVIRPFPIARDLGKGLWVGFLSRFSPIFHRIGRRQDTQRVSSYYRAQRYNEADVDILDTSTSWFAKFSFQFLRDTLSHQFFHSVVEIGSGQLKTVHELEKIDCQFDHYTGIDLYISDGEISKAGMDRRIELIQGDARQELSDVLSRYRDSCLIISINSLCYVDELDFLKIYDPGTSIAPCDELNGALFLIEPFPSIYWESWFDNIRIFLRYPKYIINNLSTSYWDVVEIRMLYLFKIGSIFVWPITYGILFRETHRRQT